MTPHSRAAASARLESRLDGIDLSALDQLVQILLFKKLQGSRRPDSP